MGLEIGKGWDLLFLLSLSFFSSAGVQGKQELYDSIWKRNYPKDGKVLPMGVGSYHTCQNTHDQPQQRSTWLNISPSCCILCGKDAETHRHLFSTLLSHQRSLEPLSGSLWLAVGTFLMQKDNWDLLSTMFTGHHFKKEKKTLWHNISGIFCGQFGSHFQRKRTRLKTLLMSIMYLLCLGVN